MANWKGTAVPNTGYVENVYFNTALSVDEVVSLLSQLEYEYSSNLSETLGSDTYIYGLINMKETFTEFFVLKNGNLYVIMTDLFTPSVIFSSIKLPEMGISFEGWNPEYQNPAVLNGTIEFSESGIYYGEQNAQLSSLFSTTPFVEVQEKVTLNSFLKGIADAIRSKKGTTDKINASNFASEIAGITGGGAGAVIKTIGGWQGTPIPNSGYVENVYFNTNLNVEEVDNILSILTYEGEDFLQYNWIALKNSNGTISSFVVTDFSDGFVITAPSGESIPLIVYNSSESAFENEMVNFVGWNPDFNGLLNIPDDEILIDYSPEDNLYYGEQNDKLSSLFSTTPFVQASGESIGLSGDYDGSSIEVSENGNVDIKALIENKQIPLEVNVNVASESTLKTLLDNTKSCDYLFVNYIGDNLSDLIKYNDTENVTTFNYMFNKCSNATSFPQLDTRNGITFYYMFGDCKNATSFPQLDISNGTTFNGMFSGCKNATSFTKLDTSNGTNFSSMFSGCNKATKIDISKITASSYSESTAVFYNCNSLKAVIIRSFGTRYALHSNAFTNCYHILGKTEETYNPTGAKDGYIYVPRNMIETLSNATNWSTHATQFRALEDYTKDGTTTGEFDDEKAGL